MNINDDKINNIDKKFKLNNVKHPFLSNLVRDILFQLRYQYISKTQKIFYFIYVRI